MSDVYITKNNFSKIAEKAIGDLSDGINEICSRVYGYRDISKYLNYKEIKDIEYKRLLIEGADSYIEEYLEKFRRGALEKKAAGVFSPFVFVSTTPPKFHYDKDCEFIKKDYLNFYIPPEIDKRGVNEVEKFRVFANANKQLLVDGKEDVFILRLKAQFNLQNDLSKVVFSNSGVNDNIFGTDFDVSARIDEVMNSIDLLGKTGAGKVMLENYIYLDHYRRPRLAKEDDEDIVFEVLRLKTELVNLLIKFHLNKNSKSGFSFDKEFLEQIGFAGCSVCGKQFDL